MKKNLVLQMRGIPEVYYELIREFLHSYINCLDSSCFSFAHLIDDFDVNGSASICVIVGASEFFDDEEDFYE